MAETVRLHAGKSEAIIDPAGAWVTHLTTEQGNILLPRQDVTIDGKTKTRGGSHVCLPNFGPDASGRGLPQHGFGRTEEWIPRLVSEQVAELELPHGQHGLDEEYRNLHALLTYSLAVHALTMTLKLKNNGETPLVVSPAFHPYFQLAEDVHGVSVANKPRIIDDLGEAQFVSSTDTLELSEAVTEGGDNVAIRSRNLSTWAIWSGGEPGLHYVCVEPTQGGNTFDSDNPVSNGADTLEPGAERTYTANILF